MFNNNLSLAFVVVAAVGAGCGLVYYGPLKTDRDRAAHKEDISAQLVQDGHVQSQYEHILKWLSVDKLQFIIDQGVMIEFSDSGLNGAEVQFHERDDGVMIQIHPVMAVYAQRVVLGEALTLMQDVNDGFSLDGRGYDLESGRSGSHLLPR